MLSYVTVGTNDLEKSIPFFTELLGTQGATKMFDHPRGAIFGKDGKPVMSVVTPFDGKPATVGNGTMVALAIPSRAEVDAFYAKALALGGTSEGEPGERGPGFYMAYFRDLDGNKFALACLG
jgi:catechol 2,3-dioxygenase-like lactoylglutathione lyase family enzyme